MTRHATIGVGGRRPPRPQAPGNALLLPESGLINLRSCGPSGGWASAATSCRPNQTLLDLLVGVAGSHETPIAGEGSYSVEAVVSGSYSYFMYDFPKFAFGVEVTVFPSLTDSGRVRLQADGRVRRDIISDFHVSVSIFDTFGRPPTAGAAKNDWGPVVSVGYKF